jgi:hypothetical protein
VEQSDCILKASNRRLTPAPLANAVCRILNQVHLELLIPDLIAPGPVAMQGLDLRVLERLLGRAVRTIGAPARLYDWLGDASGLRALLAEGTPVPCAALSLLGDGGVPGASGWLRADPVHLRVDRDQLLPDALPATTLSVNDAARLVATLNAHFAADAMKFSMTGARTWYVETGEPPDASFTPLSEVDGNNADLLRPHGPDAMAWQRIGNEVQMLLHEHPVNLAREGRGELPINSVWFWGAGVLPQAAELRYRQIWSDDPVARGIAILGGVRAAAAPLSARQWLERETESGEGRYLVMLDGLRKAAREQGIDAWRAALRDCERDWFASLQEALRRDRIGMLTIHALAPHCTLSAEIIRGDLAKFWRRAKPLSAYAGDRP